FAVWTEGHTDDAPVTACGIGARQDPDNLAGGTVPKANAVPFGGGKQPAVRAERQPTIRAVSAGRQRLLGLARGSIAQHDLAAVRKVSEFFSVGAEGPPTQQVHGAGVPEVPAGGCVPQLNSALGTYEEASAVAAEGQAINPNLLAQDAGIDPE